MALNPQDFLEPTGELSSDMFPGKDCLTLAVGWLKDAESRTTDEAAQEAWVYYRAYRNVASRLNRSLASEKRGDRQASRIATQLEYWDDLARERRADYDELTGRRRRIPAGSTEVEVEPTW